MQHHEDQIALEDHAWFHEAQLNAPRPITESLFINQVAQTCFFVGSSHGRVLTNVLTTKIFKRKVPITDLQPPLIMAEHVEGKTTKIQCKHRAFSAGQGV